VDSAWSGAARACADRYRAHGIDPSAYSTRAIAEDLEDLRMVMRVAQWNLYGESYSTLVMVETLREHGATVRSAILDSPMDVHFDETAAASVIRGLNIVFDACAVLIPCAAKHPALREKLGTALDRLDHEPRWIQLPAAAGHSDSIRVTGSTLGRAFAGLVNNPRALPMLPRLVDLAARGSISAFAPIFADDASPSSYTQGLRLAVWCADVVPFEDSARVASQEVRSAGLGAARLTVVPAAACRAAGITPAKTSESSAPVDVPVLLLSGETDPNTPTPWARAMLSWMPKAQLLVFPGRGHVPGFTECGGTVIGRFLSSPVVPVTDRCIDASPGIAFVP
jgi:pimeloyl-ACP methyl ester carboxylesterase